MAKKSDEGKAWAFLAILLSIIGFLLVLLLKKDNKYAVYYAQQSLVLFIAAVIVSIASAVPIIGWFIIAPLGSLLITILWIIGLVYSLSGEMKPVPLIGKFGESFNL
jgi:uncharacterized membrane protein